VKPAGQYHFGPGEEMQHDISPHDAKIAGKLRRVQTASLVLCYCRMIFIQCFASFTRSEACWLPSTTRTAGCGPARPVVWEGSSRDHRLPPIPIKARQLRPRIRRPAGSDYRAFGHAVP